MTIRCEEPGWTRIGAMDTARRRSLWLRLHPDAFELCAGREGDDAYVRVDRANPQYEELLDVVLTARFASET